jgi:hypothetical protein
MDQRCYNSETGIAYFVCLRSSMQVLDSAQILSMADDDNMISIVPACAWEE